MTSTRPRARPCAPTCSSWGPGRRGPRRRRGRRGPGCDVVLADAAVFPRDKTCGDGLTPRAIGELERLGLGDWVRAHTVNHGLRAHGFGQTLLLPWPGGSLPAYGSAVARTELDDHLRTTAIKAGAQGIDGARAVDVRLEGGRVAARRVRPRTASGSRSPASGCVVADGVRSTAGQEARPGVAPGHGVRRRRAVLRRLREARRPLDQQPPRAARRGRRDPVRLRLDLPAGGRPGEHRRRHARHREAARPTSRCAR